jgi:hypothetical protein
MDRFIAKKKRGIDEKSGNDDSVETQRLKSDIVSVPTCDVSASSVDSSISKPKIPKI